MTPVVGVAIAIDVSSRATADLRYRQLQPTGVRQGTAPRSYVAATTKSTSVATTEFRAFRRSRSSPTIHLECGAVHIGKSSDLKI